MCVCARVCVVCVCVYRSPEIGVALNKVHGISIAGESLKCGALKKKYSFSQT